MKIIQLFFSLIHYNAKLNDKVFNITNISRRIAKKVSLTKVSTGYWLSVAGGQCRVSIDKINLASLEETFRPDKNFWAMPCHLACSAPARALATRLSAHMPLRAQTDRAVPIAESVIGYRFPDGQLPVIRFQSIKIMAQSQASNRFLTRPGYWKPANRQPSSLPTQLSLKSPASRQGNFDSPIKFDTGNRKTGNHQVFQHN
jgi:hypothetical protein